MRKCGCLAFLKSELKRKRLVKLLEVGFGKNKSSRCYPAAFIRFYSLFFILEIVLIQHEQYAKT